MKHTCLFFLATVLMVSMTSCNREDDDRTSAATIDTLPNSEWWECDSVNCIAMNGRTLTLNISWDEELLRSYTNILENPFSLEEGKPVRFHIVNDTMYYQDLGVYYPNIPHAPIWRITRDSDTTMTFACCGGMILYSATTPHRCHFVKR